MDKEAPLNARNFKTKPPDDTAFVRKMMRAPPHVGLFRKVPTETKSISY